MANITFLYRADSTGPVCKRLGEHLNTPYQVVYDEDPNIWDRSGVLLRWGSRAPIPWYGMVLNSAEAVATAKDKVTARKALKGLCPPTWFDLDGMEFPCVVRPGQHHGGQNFSVVNSPKEALDETRRKIHRRYGWYGSPLIYKWKEFRIFLLCGKVLAVSERLPGFERGFAWNLQAGGNLINVRFDDWPLQAIKACSTAAFRLQLDLCAMDVALDYDERPWVFEANTAPGLRNPYTMGRIAKALDWTVEHGKALPPVDFTSWKSVMHDGLLKEPKDADD